MMKTGLAMLAMVIVMLACGASEASAWVCRAGGVGATAFGGSRSVAVAEDHGRCAGASGAAQLHVCTILYCR